MLKPLSLEHARLVREFLASAQYTQKEFQEKLPLREMPARGSPDLQVWLERLRDPSTLHVLLRCFYLGVPIDAQTFRTAVPDPVRVAMETSGMVLRDGESITAAITLTPSDPYWIAADTAAKIESQDPDLIVWPNPTTKLLDQFAIRQPVQKTLDLGAGCGVQAVLAAAHSGQVTATDLNPRAEVFTCFNAALNGIANVEYLNGDTFEPVRNRTFDLILSNPPFFVTPTQGRLYCESGMELDGYCRRVMREAPDHLSDGGWFQMVFEWVQLRGQSWQERLLTWIQRIPCDIWIFRGYSRNAETYARERCRQSAKGDQILEHWLSYYEQNSVEQIHGGLLAMRRRHGSNWLRIQDMPLEPGGPFGEAVLQGFASMDFLETNQSDEAMLAACPRISPDAVLDQQMRQADGQWRVSRMQLRFAAGIPDSINLDPSVAGFLARLDGRRTLREAIEELAKRVYADSGTVQQECLKVVRKLLQTRFLIP
ncbi:MAG: methyltransferase [Bryobacteraceae bacterium]